MLVYNIILSFTNAMFLLDSNLLQYNGTVTAARKLRIAYNISLRRLFGIRYFHIVPDLFPKAIY